MAKEKVQLTPEELAAKKLKRRKGWARFGAIVCAVAITAAVYVVGSKKDNKVDTQPNKDVAVVAPATTPATTKKQEETTKAPETTTAAASSSSSTTKKAADNSSGGGILDSITGLLGNFDISSITGALGGLGDKLGGLTGGSGGGLALPDMGGVADKIEDAGGKAKDFFYDVADKAEGEDTSSDDDKNAEGTTANPVDSIADTFNGLGDKLKGLLG